MIGMIILAVVAVLIFFGVTNRYFDKMGVANWVAFLIVLAFAVAAMFPPLVTGGGVSFSYAGFFLPLLLGTVCLFAIGANGSLLRAIVGALSVAGIVIAARITFVPTADYNAAIPSMLIAGFASGIAASIIGQGRLATLGATLIGIVLGDFICAMIFRFVTGSTGYMLKLGQSGIFDTVTLAALVGGIVLEAVGFIKRLSYARAPVPALAQIEAAEDNPIPKADNMIPSDDDDDVYDDYFNDDID